MLLDMMGQLVNSGDRPHSRTAHLRMDYRSVTPAETELAVSAWLVSEMGRKRVVRAELHHGDRLCAEAEGLFIAPPAAPA
jgi:hypothetical protein